MLDDKKVAILAADGFEQSELTEPLKALQDAGAEVHIVSLESGEIRGEKDHEWADKFKVDKKLAEVSAADYHALVLPGGVRNPDILRGDKAAVDFVKAFYNAKKPIGAICHGPWLLIEADVLRGRDATSYASIKTDMKNAGANWLDQEVVVDEGLVTSRNPGDLDAFCKKLIEEIAEGRHEHRRQASA